jgi:hypothetical protein
MSETTSAILQFAKTCPPCEQALHDRCWQYLGELLGHEYTPCKCFPQCRDEHGELTQAALAEMARRQPEALARKIRFDTGFAERSSLRFHLRPGGRRWSGPGRT